MFRLLSMPLLLRLLQSLAAPETYWAIGLSLFMLSLGLALANRYSLLRWWMSQRLAHRFSPLVIDHALRGYRPISLPDCDQPLLPTLTHRYLSPAVRTYRYVLLLAAEGGGKTTALLRLYLRQAMPWGPWRHVHLLRAADPDALAQLAHLPDPARTLLLIDGLDEDPQLARLGRTRLDAWLAATRPFGRVVLSCDPTAWPGPLTRIAEGEAIRYTGESEVQLLACLAWEPMPPAATSRWLRGLQGLRLPDPARPAFRVSRLAQLLEEAVPAVQQPARHAPRFWQAVAQAMARRAAQGQGLALPAPRLHDLHVIHAPNWELKRLISSLLWRDGQGCYQFHHQAVAAYFLSAVGLEHPQEEAGVAWAGLTQALAYRQERLWLALLAQPEQARGWFRTPQAVARRPLREMQASEVQQVSRLYVPADWHALAPTLLPGLPQLQGLYLIDADRQRLTADWLEALPHSRVLVYFLDGTHHLREVWHYQATAGEWLGGQGTALRGQAQSFVPVNLEVQPPLAQPWPHPSGGWPEDRGVRQWLRQEIGEALDRVVLWPDAPPYEVRLPQAAWELFHRLRVWPGADGRVNLMLDQAFPSTLLVSELRPLVAALVTRMGEDDAHRRTLTPDDEAQLEDGFWTGRRWLWGNTDRYASPLRLVSTRPGYATLSVWNVQL